MATGSKDVPLVYLIAGEPSGDRLGARLIAALREETQGGVRISGVGGPEMEKLGLTPLFPMADLSVMGVAEVLPRLPLILARIQQTVTDVRARLPAVVVTIDAPEFSFRVAARLKSEDIPLIHYVAPSVWAWRPGRAAKIAKFLDHLMTLLPFEPPYFEAEGLSATYVGHPVVESDYGDGNGFRHRHGIATEAPLIAALPGSRISEVSRLLPIFTRTIARLSEIFPNLRVVMPTVETVASTVRHGLEGWPIPVIVIDTEGEKIDALAAADVSLAASGTVALELAMSGTPAVITYRMNPISGWLAKRLIHVRFANLVNLILDHEAIPERLLNRCRPEVLIDDLSELLGNPDAQAAQRTAYDQALTELGRGGDVPPSRRAARVVLSVIGSTAP